MTKDVIVAVSSLQTDVNQKEIDEETMEVISPGKYSYKDGIHYVFFEEMIEGNTEVTKTQIRIQDSGVVEVIRKGGSSTHMIFDRRQKNRAFYQTPYGQLNLGVYTKSMEILREEEHLRVDMRYQLDVNYEPYLNCTMGIDIKSRASEEFTIL